MPATIDAAATVASINWDLVALTLPAGTDDESRAARRDMFYRCDIARQGRLTLQAFAHGMRNEADIPGVDYTPAIDSAFAIGWETFPHKSDLGERAIDYRGFRVAVVYLQHYVELWDLFHDVGEDGVLRVCWMPLHDALPQLIDWGLRDVSASGQPSCDRSACSGVLADGALFCQKCGSRQHNKGMFQDIPEELRAAHARINEPGADVNGFVDFADVCIRRGPFDLYEDDVDIDRGIGKTQYISAPPPPATRPPRPSPRQLPLSAVGSSTSVIVPESLRRDIARDEASCHQGLLVLDSTSFGCAKRAYEDLPRYDGACQQNGRCGHPKQTSPHASRRSNWYSQVGRHRDTTRGS